MDSSFEEIKPQAVQFRNKFEIIMNSLKALGKQLDEVQIGENEVAQQYIPVINDAKNTILIAIQKETADQLQEINTFDDVLVLRDRAKSLLNRLGDTGGSHRRTIHNFFGKHAKVLKFELELLDKETKRLNGLIDSYTEKTSSFVDCKESMTRVSSAMNTEEAIVRKQKEIREELEALRSKEPVLVKKIEDFKRTEEYTDYMKSKEELERVNNAANNVLSDVNAAFSRISRPLSKYTYEVGLDKESNYLIQSIMDNPINLIRDAKIDQIIEILNKVRESVQKGRVTTKNPEKDVENINLLTSNLHDYVKQYKEYDSSTRELGSKTIVIDRKLESMRNELEGIRGEIQQKESYLNDYSKQMTDAKSTMNDELKNISARIESASGSRVKIVI